MCVRCGPKKQKKKKKKRGFELCFYVFIYLFCFLGPHLWHVEVLRLGVELELQLLALALATAVQDPSCVCNLHQSSWQPRILNSLILIYLFCGNAQCHCPPLTHQPVSPHVLAHPDFSV